MRYHMRTMNSVRDSHLVSVGKHRPDATAKPRVLDANGNYIVAKPRVLDANGNYIVAKPRRTMRWVFNGEWFAVGGNNYGYSTQDDCRRAFPEARHEFERVR